MSLPVNNIFETTFNQTVAPTVILEADGTDFRVVAQNEHHKLVTGNLKRNMTGKRAFELFVPEPENSNKLAAYATLVTAFTTCIAEKTIVKLPPVRQDSGEVWMQTEVIPVLDAAGDVEYLFCATYDISKQIILKHAEEDGLKREQDLTEELAASNEELRASNEELNASNEELRQSQESLFESNTDLEDRVEQRTKALAESEARFRTMVEQSPVPMLVTMGKAMIFEIINQPMLDLIGKDASVIGKPWNEAMPELEGQDIIETLLDTYDSGKSWYGDEVPIMIYKTDAPVLGFYNISYKPLVENGQTIGMLQSAIDVTALVKSRLLVEDLNHEQQAINEELTASNEELATINAELNTTKQLLEQIINILPASVVVIRGQELIVESINKANLAYWHKTSAEVIGKPLLDILPELSSQAFPGQLRGVMETGEVVDVKESPVIFISTKGEKRETFVDYTYQPLTDVSGTRTGVLVMSFEITERVESRKLLEQYSEELQSVNEELSASNEEIVSTNEELSAANEALIEIQDELTSETTERKYAIERLRASEQNLRNMVLQAPVGMCIVQGEPLYAVEINESFLKIIGKTAEQLKTKPYWEAIPEAAPFYEPITNQVIATGETYYANEHEIMLVRQGEEEIVHVDFVYEPIKDAGGTTYAIMIVAIDVTDKVLARKKIEEAEETLRMAIASGELGTWYLNERTGEFNASARFNEIFGFEPGKQISYSEAFSQIQPDYHQQVQKAVDASLKDGASFNVEYPITAPNKGKQRWVRSVGKFVPDDDKGNYIAGVVADITEQKADDIRKSDFIGMVSHELKTPLTSLNGYLQLLNRKAQEGADNFTANALEQSAKQVRKMTKMINGFLNVSRLESGKINIDRHPFDMADLVKESEAETVLMNSTHTFIFHPVEQTIVDADRDKIGQVINNLISNAVKYSRAGTTIQIACITVDGQARLSVSDEGMGIGSQHLDHLFQRYYRVDNGNNISGFGIGLYLCAEIIERHEGKIWVESEQGKGSTFYFNLPLAIDG